MTKDNDDNDGLSDETRKILSSLTPRELKVLQERLGVNIKSEKSLKEAFVNFDITREKIRKIEEKALRKLRGNSDPDDAA